MSPSNIEVLTLLVRNGSGKLIRCVCRVSRIIGFVLDGIHFTASAYIDYKNGTSRNVVESIASSAGGWAGSSVGAKIGAAVGTMICPGVGTMIGGIIGSIVGSLAGSHGASCLIDVIGDACDYDIVEKNCKKCDTRFKCHKYLGEGDKCPKCHSEKQDQ